MINIRPISDLRNKFTEIESVVKEEGAVYLTKNGYGSMVVMSMDEYARLTDPVEMALDQADRQAERDARRLTHDEVFGQIKEKYNAR